MFMLRTREILSTLLAVDARKGSEEYKRVRTFPVLLGVINLLFCSYMDHFLKQDVGGHYLSLLLFVECSMFVLITVGSFSKSGIEILSKSSVFPTSPWSRLLFVLLSFLRKPAILMLLLTTIIFFVVLFFSSFVVASLALLLYVLLILNVLVLTAVACVKISASAQPIVSIAVVGVFVIIVVLINSIVFHFTVLLGSLPVLSWAVKGIVAVRNLHVVQALFYCSYLTVSFVALLFVGKKLA
jgi:hypothetical protein